ncbi:hypothetical protein CcaCcLH18_07428 [Colletotrichum camelliae]|nr:hypothetical protein CcaCcLH18_07428 [Colletotrichum camelliae]
MGEIQYTCDELGEEVDINFEFNHERQKFLPGNRLHELVMHEKVDGAFKDAGLQDAPDLLDFATRLAQKAFLILVLMSTIKDKKLYLLRELMTNGFTDEWLPVQFAVDPKSRRSTLSSITSENSTGLSDEWTRTVRDAFERYQWELAVPIFDTTARFYFSFTPGTVMPYMKAPLKPQGRGFFGEVSCYEMHAAHLRFPGSSANTAKPPIKLAVKKANDNADLAKFFRKEAKNLNALKNNTTPNLIKPIAAYEFKGDKYLLFPWAEGGSLSNCWRCWKAGPLDPDGMEWIINQFRGIFLALGQLHDSNCRHGDLKPDNILWFKDARNKGELQIADLGLATFHQLDADTRKREELVIQTTTPTGTRRYQAPETDGEQYHRSNPPRSRSYDMWSMGCVMFELLIWLAYGNDDVETFQRSTPDFFWERVSSSTTLPKIKYRNVTKAPTRLIDVGELCLVSSNSVSVSDYVALSHCWGKLEKHQRFCLYKDNINELQRSIEFERLPQNFKDAVIVTRGLGIRYLWIDSICIIQDDAQDWEVESSKMEEVFSSACVTISAVSAKSSLDGFLGERPSRACVQVQADGKQPLYVCPTIDDFHRDVELGEISKRGWVLQERALSRRTIYYTSTQVYWECGAGVRCETLRRLYNPKSAFLGDANFPHSALNHYKDGRQMLIQDLYERYSALEFSYSSDRAVAILGLQKRLARAFETRATYGLFATYLHRGLLWRRDQAEPMKIIAQPSGRHVPSWSWFSKIGAIKYMDLKFDSVKWTNDLESPFIGEASGGSMGFTGVRSASGAPVVRALAKELKLSKDELLKYVTFDDRDDFEIHELLFAVIGCDKDANSMEVRISHGLIIRQLMENLDKHDQDTYERVGVASLRPCQIMDGGSWVKIC